MGGRAGQPAPLCHRRRWTETEAVGWAAPEPGLPRRGEWVHVFWPLSPPLPLRQRRALLLPHQPRRLEPQVLLCGSSLRVSCNWGGRREGGPSEALVPREGPLPCGPAVLPLPAGPRWPPDAPCAPWHPEGLDTGGRGLGAGRRTSLCHAAPPTPPVHLCLPPG